MDDIIFEDDVVKNYVENNSHSIDHVIEGIMDIYSPDSGWSVDDPVIIPNPDGKTVTMTFHVTKREVQKSRTR